MEIIKDTYIGIEGKSEGLFKDQGSRFIASAWPVESPQEVKDILDGIHKEYHDARHHCYAYRIGPRGEMFRANDDGEPSSSAGRPILGQIDSRGLSDTLVVVVRYFGGIKLGIPGLIRAYKSAAADALDHARVIEKTACESYALEFDYMAMNSVQKLLKDMKLPQSDQDFGQKCSLRVRVRLGAVESFLSGVADIEGCKAEPVAPDR